MLGHIVARKPAPVLAWRPIGLRLRRGPTALGNASSSMGGYTPYSSVSTEGLTPQAIQVDIGGVLPGPVNVASEGYAGNSPTTAGQPWEGSVDEQGRPIPLSSTLPFSGDAQQVVIAGSRGAMSSSTSSAVTDSQPALYPNGFNFVPATGAVSPIGGIENLQLARDLALLDPRLAPTSTVDGRSGMGVPFRDTAGNVFYKTFDANGSPLGWMAVTAAASETSSEASLAAAAAGAILNTEETAGPPILKAAALLTLGGAAIWAGQQKVALDPGSPLNNWTTPGFGEDRPSFEGPVVTPPLSDEERKWFTTPSPFPIGQIDLPPLPSPAIVPLHWSDLIVESRDADQLGKALEADGYGKPGDGYQPHHMIPVSDPRAAGLQDLLDKAGIPVNSGINGVWLPQNDSVPNLGETLHNETFRNSYFEYLNEQMAGANPADPIDIAIRLSDIRSDLLTGKQDFPRQP